MTADTIFKTGYDGVRPSTSLSGPEKQIFREARTDLRRRVHDAMLCLSVSQGPDDLRVRGGAPESLTEFSDMVGREKDPEPRPRFRPTAAQIDDVPAALGLMEGLTKVHFKVVFLRALDEFGSADWPWHKIGGTFGMSDRWAESAHDAAMVQAARRAGVLPMATRDYAILVTSAYIDAVRPADRHWRTHVATSADPRQEASNMRSKSPIKLDGAVAIWTPGQPVAKRVVQEAKRTLPQALHGSWVRIAPEEMIDRLVQTARSCGSTWHLEELDARIGLA
jgi:hypothetical protein